MNTLGFTGTRNGMTFEQHAALQKLFAETDAQVFIHGDCIGADITAALLAYREGFTVLTYPADIHGLRGWFSAGKIAPPAPPLVRNRRIVNNCDMLIAAPSGTIEVLRSGTWSTVRYARRQGKPITIIYPDGTVVKE